MDTHEEEIIKDTLRYKEIVADRKILNDIPRARVTQRMSRTRARSPKGPKLKKPLYRAKLKSEKDQKQKVTEGGNKGLVDKRSTRNQSNGKEWAVWDIHSKAASFEDKLSVSADYDRMIQQVRENVEDIDFGLSHKFVAKNIAYETARFACDMHTTPLRGASFSDDIDFFLRSLEQDPFTSPVPLI